MQYTIRLPADYDMHAIEARVEERKPLFDSVPGLVHKSYLANYEYKFYAPFYIWDDITQMRNFLMDDLFSGVATSFSRPRVRTWAVLNQRRGAFDGMPTHAVRSSDPIAPEEALDAVFEQEKQQQEALLANPNLYLSVLGLDADRWEILRYEIWKDEKSAARPQGDIVHSYRVLHV